MEGSGFLPGGNSRSGGGVGGGSGGSNYHHHHHHHHHHHDTPVDDHHDIRHDGRTQDAGLNPVGFGVGAFGGALWGFFGSNNPVDSFADTVFMALFGSLIVGIIVTVIWPRKKPDPWAEADPHTYPSQVGPFYHTSSAESIPVLGAVVSPEYRRSRRSGCCTLSCCVGVLLVIVFVLVAIVVPKPTPIAVEVVNGDRKLLPLDAFWSKGVEIERPNNVDVYLLDHSPPLGSPKTFPPKLISPNIFDGSYYFVRYDLHENSQVKIDWDFQNTGNLPPSFVIIRSTHAFNSWKTHPASVRATFKHFESETYQGHYTFTSPTYAEYYFIFFGKHHAVKAEGIVTFRPKLITYSLPDPSEILGQCGPEDVTCSLDYSTLNTAVVLFSAPWSDGNAFTAVVKPSPRMAVYYSVVFWPLGIFTLVLCACTGICTCCSYCFCRTECDEEGESHRNILVVGHREIPMPPFVNGWRLVNGQWVYYHPIAGASDGYAAPAYEAVPAGPAEPAVSATSREPTPLQAIHASAPASAPDPNNLKLLPLEQPRPHHEPGPSNGPPPPYTP
ncbi:uncharacterized protein BJ171DRAFT_599679 [Polychytrium aggregatum]|uniref:uncharacterized protein n=1 Tax=Polychytrium aggregatum TaxID=110093 RepID=UPI0022FE1196|nr:uncharacterized protein BJ171DRAFT_599679 [Polychytrium aggregatum]KAI9203769.1 hypothetical protein BJ171DRAFT_599679 [Polychytrium aggregatum]